MTQADLYWVSSLIRYILTSCLQEDMISRVIVVEVKKWKEQNSLGSKSNLDRRRRRYLEIICMKRLEGNEELLLMKIKGLTLITFFQDFDQ